MFRQAVSIPLRKVSRTDRPLHRALLFGVSIPLRKVSRPVFVELRELADLGFHPSKEGFKGLERVGGRFGILLVSIPLRKVSREPKNGGNENEKEFPSL